VIKGDYRALAELCILLSALLVLELFLKNYCMFNFTSIANIVFKAAKVAYKRAYD